VSPESNGAPIGQVLTRLGVWTAHPSAFLIIFVYAAGWIIFEPSTLDWHAFATLATWAMTLFIQRAEHRDTQAIHLKLDELLRVDEQARSSVANADKKEPEEIEAERDSGPT
jgi:low affinity Fe/Cu permease